MAELPADPQLTSEIHDILRNNDLEKITLRIVMKMLSERLSVPPTTLVSKKPFVRETVNQYLENSYQPNQEDEQNSSAKAARKKRKADDGIPKPVRLTGLERAVVLAQPLADFLGVPVIGRSNIPKRISSYARENNLQNPEDKRTIFCDDALKKALSVEEFTFFQLAKLVSGLVYKPEECSEELQALARTCEEEAIQQKIKKREESIANGDLKPKPSRATKKQKAVKGGDTETKKRMTGIMKPMQLSAELVAVVGVTQLSRPEVLKKIWEYIRANDLKDPNNATRILCDEKLQAVFDGSESVSNMGINKFLSAHMTKIP